MQIPIDISRPGARWTIISLVALVLTLGVQERAHACTCLPIIDVVPNDGATDVPTNARVLVVSNFDLPSSPQLLRDETEVATTFVPGQTMQLVPLEPLEPGAAYRVLFEGSELASFRVGDQADDTPPPAVAMDGFEIATVDLSACNIGGGSCLVDLASGQAFQAHFDALVSGVAAWSLEWTAGVSDDGSTPRTYLGSSQIHTARTNGNFCSPVPPTLVTGQTYCARLVTTDLAGHESFGPERCTRAESCGAASDERCELPEACTLFDYIAPIEPPPPTTASGCALVAPGHASLPWLLAATLVMLVGRTRRRRC